MLTPSPQLETCIHNILEIDEVPCLQPFICVAMEKMTLCNSAKLVALVWVVCMQAAAQLGMVEGKKANVTITNRLQQQLRVHCGSGDDDLGQHVLEPYFNGNGVYPISFSPNIWGNTAFGCVFSCDAYGMRNITVWVGWLSRWNRPGQCKCWNCDWVVTPNGFSCNGEYHYSWRP